MTTPVGEMSMSTDGLLDVEDVNEAQRPEGAGEQGRDRERTECGEDAQHEGKEQLRPARGAPLPRPAGGGRRALRWRVVRAPATAACRSARRTRAR